MTRRIQLLVALLGLAMATPAAAQVRDHRRKKPAARVTASDFTPHSGGVGTAVTIRGRGFTPETRVVFGGRPVRPDRVTPTAITFAVPARYGDGAIVVRHPGVARDIDLGSFAVITPPVIGSFAPVSGISGTRVEIRGTGFQPGDVVSVGGQILPQRRLTRARIIVTIPANAASGPIVITRADGAQGTSKRAFTVIQPAPTITALAPANGPPGTVVRITGVNFTGNEVAYYGKKPMKVTQRGVNYIDVIVPHVRKNSFVWINAATGEARSPAKFVLEQPPVINRISPLRGTAGQRIDVFGENFRAGDRLLLNNVALPIVQLRRTQITSRIPPGAVSGALVVERGAMRVTASQLLDVVYPPSITDFSPTGGEPGTKVKIRGSGFSADAKVFYGTQPLRILKRRGQHGSHVLVVKIPDGVADQAFTVRTRGGDAMTARAFQVYYFSTIADVQPRYAFPGTRLTITGKQLGYVDKIYVGSQPLNVIRRARKDRQLVVEVPQGTAPGLISFTSFGQRFDTKIAIEIQRRPILAAFAPKAGAPGSDITLSGHNFTGRTLVYFGKTRLTVIRATPTQIIVRLPGNIDGVDHLWLEELDARIRSKQPFIVAHPPTITSFSPMQGKPGTEVVINCRKVGPRAEVLLDNIPLPIIARKRGQLVVRLPNNIAAGKPHFFLRDKNLGSSSAKPFEVLASAVIDGFSPNRGAPGTQVIVTGRSFDKATRIFFGNVELPIAKRRPGRLWVTIPNRIAGADYLMIDDGGVQSVSRDKFQVVQPAPPPPPPPPKVKVRDHRKRGR